MSLTDPLTPVVQDLEYERARNALIPTAEAEADSIAGRQPSVPRGIDYEKHPEHSAWARRWNIAYHSAMTRLWMSKR